MKSDGFATQRLRTDIMKHVSDIAEKYLITGETQDTALMFVPSESVYAEIHDGFDDVIQKAYRARVVLVSPSLLMLAIQVMQQILKDARIRDAADQIRNEVMHLGDDLTRLRERVLKLQKHFGDVNEDVRQILISADKIEKRAGRIEELDFSKEPPVEAPRLVKGAHRAIPAAAQAAGGGVIALRSLSDNVPAYLIVIARLDRATQYPRGGRWGHASTTCTFSPIVSAARYIGVTNNLIRRVGEHKLKMAEGFTKRHEITRLVYFEALIRSSRRFNVKND